MPESYLTYNALIRTNDINDLFYQLYAKSFIHIEKKLTYIVIHIEKTLIYIVKTTYMQ